MSRHSSERDRVDPDSGPFVPTLGHDRRDRTHHIQRALSRAGGSVSKTADLLGNSRKTLWKKMKRLSISGLKEPNGARVN